MKYIIGNLRMPSRETWEKKEEELRQLLKSSGTEYASSGWLISWIKQSHKTLTEWRSDNKSLRQEQACKIISCYLELGRALWAKYDSLKRAGKTFNSPLDDSWAYTEVLQALIREMFDIMLPNMQEVGLSVFGMSQKTSGSIFLMFDFLLKLSTVGIQIGDRTRANILKFIDGHYYPMGSRFRALPGWSQYCLWEDKEVAVYAQYLAELALAYNPDLLVQWKMFEAAPVVAGRITKQEQATTHGTCGEVWYIWHGTPDYHLRQILATLKAEEEYVLKFRAKSEDKRMPVAWRKLPVPLPSFS